MGQQASNLNGQNRSEVSQVYETDGPFNKIRSSGHVDFELTHVNDKPSIEIKTEQWVHEGHIKVLTSPNRCLHVELERNRHYPPITVYVKYQNPLASLETDGASSMTSTNTVHSDKSTPLDLVHSGASKAQLELNHDSDLDAKISGASQVILTGQVRGNGKFSISGSAQLNQMDSPMETVEVETSGSGKAYINAKTINACASGAGEIYYRGALLNQHTSGAGKIIKN